MSFQDHFDAILCVNLDDRPDRWVEAVGEAARHGITKMKRFPGVLRANGHRGAAEAHIGLWRELAAGKHGTGDAGDRVLVLEDDFLFVNATDLLLAGYPLDSQEVRIFSEVTEHDLSSRFAHMFAEVPRDWDMLWLGGGYQKRPFARVAPHVIRHAGMLGMHAYAITRAAATSIVEDLANLYHRDEWPLAFDNTFMLVLAKHMRFYTLSPRLFVQRPSPSSTLPNEAPPPHFASSYVDARHELMVGR